MFIYEYIGNGYSITDYVGEETDIIIPHEYDDGVNGNDVVIEIGESAFENKGLTSVKFQEGLKFIRSRAFKDNLFNEFTVLESMLEINDGGNDSVLDGTPVTILNMFNPVIQSQHHQGFTYFYANIAPQITILHYHPSVIESMWTFNIRFTGLTDLYLYSEVVVTPNNFGFANYTNAPINVHVPKELYDEYSEIWSSQINNDEVKLHIITTVSNYRELGSLYLDTDKIGAFKEIRLTKEETIQELKDGNIETEEGVIYASNKPPVTEAPIDNKAYARKDSTWVETLTKPEIESELQDAVDTIANMLGVL